MPSIESTLAERGARYGAFPAFSDVTQTLKAIFKSKMGEKWDLLADDQKEALEMIAHKLARIITGDPHYDDSWRDIAGYAQLVANRLAAPAAAPATDTDKPTANPVVGDKGTQTQTGEPCNCPICSLERALAGRSQGKAETTVVEISLDDETDPFFKLLKTLAAKK